MGAFQWVAKADDTFGVTTALKDDVATLDAQMRLLFDEGWISTTARAPRWKCWWQTPSKHGGAGVHDNVMPRQRPQKDKSEIGSRLSRFFCASCHAFPHTSATVQSPASMMTMPIHLAMAARSRNQSTPSITPSGIDS